MEPITFPQDHFIQECKDKIAELTREEEKHRKERQEAEKRMRAASRAIRDYQEELRLHQSAKLEEMERRAQRASQQQPASPPASVPPPSPQPASPPPAASRQTSAAKRVDKKRGKT